MFVFCWFSFFFFNCPFYIWHLMQIISLWRSLGFGGFKPHLCWWQRKNRNKLLQQDRTSPPLPSDSLIGTAVDPKNETMWLVVVRLSIASNIWYPLLGLIHLHREVFTKWLPLNPHECITASCFLGVTIQIAQKNKTIIQQTYQPGKPTWDYTLSSLLMSRDTFTPFTPGVNMRPTCLLFK